MKYYVSIGSKTFEVDVNGERVTLDGTTVEAHLDPMPGGDLYVLRIGDTVHRFRARRDVEGGRGHFDIGVDGHRFSVEALDERARAIRELSRGVERPTGPMRLVAPMPGLVVRVNVAEGDRVHAGQGLVVMEAMKMENELKAATAGLVSRVAVGAGSAVEKGALLLELEAVHEGG